MLSHTHWRHGTRAEPSPSAYLHICLPLNMWALCWLAAYLLRWYLNLFAWLCSEFMKFMPPGEERNRGLGWHSHICGANTVCTCELPVLLDLLPWYKCLFRCPSWESNFEIVRQCYRNQKYINWVSCQLIPLALMTVKPADTCGCGKEGCAVWMEQLLLIREGNQWLSIHQKHPPAGHHCQVPTHRFFSLLGEDCSIFFTASFKMFPVLCMQLSAPFGGSQQEHPNTWIALGLGHKSQIHPM